METPNTRAGRITEQIMQEVLRKLPEITTSTYNRIYESVIEVLEAELKSPVDKSGGAPHMGVRGNGVREPDGGLLVAQQHAPAGLPAQAGQQG